MTDFSDEPLDEPADTYADVTTTDEAPAVGSHFLEVRDLRCTSRPTTAW